MKKRYLKRILVLLCTVIFLMGCAHPAQESAPDTAEEPPFAADYALLWKTLETDYPYLDYLRDKGVKVDSIRKRYGERVNSVKKSESFAVIVQQMFAELDYTAHLFPIQQLAFQDLYSAYVLDPEMSESLFFAPWRETLQAAAATGQYKAPTEVSGSVETKVGNYPSVTVTYYEDCKTLCLTIPTFMFYVVERDQDVVQQAVEQYPEAENIIFNITGNSGGSDEYWRNNLVAPFGEDQTCIGRLFFKDSPQNMQIIEPYIDIGSTSEEEDAPEWAIKYGLNKYFLMELLVEGRDAVHSNAKRWVLVDHVVFSASEMFVYFCKSTGWATVVGKQTGGDGMGFSPTLHLLPDSGVLYEFSCTAGENPDGTMSIEGTTPDIVLDTVDVDHLLELIRQEQTD